MNQEVQRILQSNEERTQGELQQLLKYMTMFKDFQYLDRLHNHQQLLQELKGFHLASNRIVYDAGVLNDEQVFFLTYGEAHKSYQDKKNLLTQMNTMIRPGEFFGCYDEPVRNEQVRAMQPSFFVQMHRKYYHQLRVYNKYMLSIRTKVMKQLFPQLGSIQSTNEYHTMINVASYCEHRRGDPIVVPAFPLGATPTNELQFESGHIYVLVEGSCEISVDIIPRHQPSEQVTHFICSAEPTYVIGDEQLLSSSQWEQMTQALPLRFVTTDKQDQPIQSQFHAKVTSDIAKFLVLPVRDLLTLFPSNILKPFKDQSLKKITNYIKGLQNFCIKTFGKPPPITVIKKPVIEEEVVAPVVVNKPTSPKHSPKPIIKVESKKVLNKAKSISISKSPGYMTARPCRKPLEQPKPTENSEIHAFQSQSPPPMINRPNRLLNRILQEACDYEKISLMKKEIKNRIIADQMYNLRCKTETSMYRLPGLSPRLFVKGKTMKPKGIVDLLQYLI